MAKELEKPKPQMPKLPAGETVAPPDDLLIVTSSPHARAKRSPAVVMRIVMLALLPAAIASVYHFGARAALLIAVAIASCVAAEFLWQTAMKQKNRIADGSAALTGLLLAMTLGAQMSVYSIILGSVVAIIVAKQFFGGLGMNIWNPALIGRAFLQVAFPEMTNGGFPMPTGKTEMLISNLSAAPGAVDAVSSATPLMIPKNAELLSKVADASASWTNALGDFFIGAQPGSLGETSELALLIGGLFLVAVRLVDWRIPVGFILTTIAAMAILPYGSEAGMDAGLLARMPNALSLALSGGLFLGAFFMASDFVTSPITKNGRLIFAIGCGLITALIRLYGGYPEGVCYAILIMNTTVPLIDRHIQPKVYGKQQPVKPVEAKA